MKNLQRLAAGMDVSPAYNAILRQPELWGVTGGTTPGTITLRADGNNWFTFDMLPQLRQFVFGLMARVEGELLGDVILQRVVPGEEFCPQGREQLQEQLFIIALNAVPGVLLQVDADAAMMLSGEAWWAAGNVVLVNNSIDDAVVLLVSARPNGPATYVPPR